MQHGFRSLLELQRPLAIQITGILRWDLNCEVILTEHFPEKSVADNLASWKISRVKYDETLKYLQQDE